MEFAANRSRGPDDSYQTASVLTGSSPADRENQPRQAISLAGFLLTLGSRRLASPMYRIMWIALGGGGGSVLRYLVQGWIQRLVGESFPLGTFVVNLSGCFAIGFLAALFSAPCQSTKITASAF